MPNEDPNYIDLYDLELENKPSFDWQDGSMRRQEKLISAELISKGYHVGSWRDGERDSFGPLSRINHVITPEEDHKIIVYG